MNHLPGFNGVGSKHWWVSMLAQILDLITIKKALLIKDVAESYWQLVLDRNQHLWTNAIPWAMPCGGKKLDLVLL